MQNTLHKKTKLLLLLLFPLWGLGGYSQNYQWDWAVSGGGTYGTLGFDNDSQQIYDIKVGSDNNYYFIATIKNGTPQLNGQPVMVYSPNNSIAGGRNDIFLFSTTNTGTIRWSQAIGGGADNIAYNLVLDSNNNVYIGAFLRCYANDPIHFSASETITAVYQTNYLVKYDSNGVFQTKKALQGTVANVNLGVGQLFDLVIDSQDQLHFVVGLQKGTHLDGNVTVPNNITTYQYFVVKYDANLDYISSILLPIADGTGFPGVGPGQRFAYDENLNRYYMAGMRSYNITAALTPLTYGGKPFSERAYILAINGSNGTEVWRREVYSQYLNGEPAVHNFSSLVIDSNSDVYVGGQIWRMLNEQNLKIYDSYNPATTTYTFTPTPHTNLPTVIKFNSSGMVQWVKTPTAFAPNFTSNVINTHSKGLAINGNEIAFGSSESYFIWDSFSKNNPQFYQPDPTLLRFNKQTGTTLGMHDIKGEAGTPSYMRAVAVDNNGNYVVGGGFSGQLFTNAGGNVSTITCSGYHNFFVAKLTNPLSNEEFNNLNVNVYPNPTTDIVNIETAETLQNYEVYNVLGQQIQKGNFNGNTQINLHGATAGTYFIKVTTTQGSTATVKVVKK